MLSSLVGGKYPVNKIVESERIDTRQLTNPRVA